VNLLSGRLDRDRYETLLVAGSVGRGEEPIADLSGRDRVRLRTVPSLGPELRPCRDARALIEVARLVRRYRPAIVHTHMAKAGMIGRGAAVLAGRPRPLIVHTYHGHVLEGYFSPAVSRFYRILEQMLARFTDCLVGVSDKTVDDLVRLGVSPREKFRTVPLGLDLGPFLDASGNDGDAFRTEAGASGDDVLLVFTGRLVAIKRVDLLIRAVAEVRGRGSHCLLAVVGDGELRAELERLAQRLDVADVVRFMGYRSDLVGITAAADIAVLSSANEGTPVFLIEAAAAARPAVATNVGGVGDVVKEETGILVEFADVDGLASAICRLAADQDLRRAMGARAREHVRTRFGVERLVADIDSLYCELLARKAGYEPKRTQAVEHAPTA
jgi:glycosyltransferase involved in cell wall biosynthesis